jgi:hypothetical protein
LNETLGVAIESNIRRSEPREEVWRKRSRIRVETDLVTLAAQDFARGQVARIQLPVRIPLRFHDSWIADS